MQTLVDNRTASGLHGDAVVSWGFDGDVGGLRRRLCGTFSWSRLAEFTTMAPFKPGLKPLTDSRLVCREMERFDDTILIMSVTSAKCFCRQNNFLTRNTSHARRYIRVYTASDHSTDLETAHNFIKRVVMNHFRVIELKKCFDDCSGFNDF